MPVDFTITVTPAAQAPVITAGPVSGTVSACAGTASADPDIQQFLVSGGSLADDITATAPAGFEIALSAPGPYQNTLTLGRTNGTVSPVPVFVRSSAAAPTGGITGNVVLVSGSTSQTVAVSASIHALPSLNPVAGQIKANGSATDAVHFNGTGDTYTWVNDTPGIGLPASGAGNIPSFTAINTGQAPVIATITVTPGSAGGCSGPAVVFTIRVEANSPATLTAEGSFAGFSTTYGTPSNSSSFTISGTNTPAGILITPPAGYEISADNTNFTNSLTVGSAGQVPSATLYIRLAAVTPVGNFTGSIVLSSGNISNASLIIASGVVSPANLIIAADDQTKPYGANNPVLTISYTGFQNNDGPAQLIQAPQISTTALTNSPIGRYDILIGGAAAANYVITYRPGVLVILPVGKLVIPNAFTPNGDGINDTWNIQNIDQFPNCTVHIYDRWGTSVYFAIGYGTPWNGNYKGKPLPFSAYYYVIDLKNDQPPLSGYVTILR